MIPHRERIGRFARRVLWLAAALAAVWTAGIVVAPLVESWTGSEVIRLIYRPLCHQQVDRSLLLGGLPLAVCARCTGLYLGGVLSLLAVAIAGRSPRSPGPVWLAAVVTPHLLDLAAQFAGWPGLPALPRLVLGVATGIVAGCLLAEGLIDLSRMTRGRPPARTRSPRLSPRTGISP